MVSGWLVGDNGSRSSSSSRVWLVGYSSSSGYGWLVLYIDTRTEKPRGRAQVTMEPGQCPELVTMEPLKEGRREEEKERRKEGKKEGRRKKRRKDGRKEGRKVGR